MRRAIRIASYALLFLCSTAAFGPAADSKPTRDVVDRIGRVLRTWDGKGRIVASQLPPPADYLRVRETTSPLPDGTGRVLPDGSVEGDGVGTKAPRSAAIAASETRLTIDFMTIGYGYQQDYAPYLTIGLLGRASRYTLSDGSSWSSGAGSHRDYGAYFDRVEVEGDRIRYFLRQPEGLLYEQTDFDSGDHSSQGTLGVSGELVLEATRGSTTAVLRGGAEIVSNTITNYSEPRFNFFSAIVGSVVPYEQTYELTSGTWQEDSFDKSFSYRRSGGWVDFANPITVPLVVGLEIQGSSQAPPESDLSYVALARFDNDSLRNVTDLATWSVSPESLASIESGVLSTRTPEGDEATLELRAVWADRGQSVEATKSVRLVRSRDPSDLEGWPTFQGNRGHTGYVPATLDPEAFSLRWRRGIGPGRRLNPVAAAGGRVFVSVESRFPPADEINFFALDARDGAELWSKSAGYVSSLNPPAHGYGNVYLQTGKGTGTSPPPLLRAYDARTGDLVFATQFGAQWESYLAPTVFDGHVYINGGTYGGMYSVDAFAGQQRWFAGLPQYDDWTPAVDEVYAYAYVGEYEPGLYVVDRLTGERAFIIPDDGFDWNGWSMDLAPVLGGRNDVIVIHDGRLVSFDVPGHRIAWQVERAFRGQPSVRDGVIYAVDGGRLVAVDQANGAELWSWSAPGGDEVQSPLIVTDTHVLAATTNETHAIELSSRTSVWSYPASGPLALGNETLYIAGSDGWLTAIAMPVYAPAALVSLEIDGPAEVAEDSTTSYVALAHYDDGRVRDRTELAEWSVEPTDLASVDDSGALSTGELIEPSAQVSLRAIYEEGGSVVEGAREIEVSLAVPIEALAQRNLAAAHALTLDAIEALDEAERRELAADEALERIAPSEADGRRDASGLRSLLRKGLAWNRKARTALVRSAESLLEALVSSDREDAATGADPATGSRLRARDRSDRHSR